MWMMPAGDMKTAAKCPCKFSLPEFNCDQIIQWKLHVTQDITLGHDFLTGLGIKIDFGNNVLAWDSIVIPMKDADVEFNKCVLYTSQNPLYKPLTG
jgi:hypothetical protein